MENCIEIGGRIFPGPHPAYGPHAQELFFHTSRYYAYTETYLRALSGRWGFQMGGYKAERLSDKQRQVLAHILAQPPGISNARCIIRIVSRVSRGDADLPEDMPLPSETRSPCPGRQHAPPFRSSPEPVDDLPPADPLLHLTRRLRITTRRRTLAVAIDFAMLARQLDSSNPTIRANLQNAILYLHQHGWHLRHLTAEDKNPAD